MKPSTTVKGLSFKWVVWPYLLETNAKHCIHVHNQMLVLQAPWGWWGKSSSRGDTLGWSIMDSEPLPGSHQFMCYQTKCMWKEQEQEQKGLHSLRKIFKCEADTYTLRQECTNIEVQTCKGEKAEAKGTTLLGAHCCNRTLGLALFHDSKRTGELLSNLTAPFLLLHTRTTRLEWKYEARQI